MPDPLCGVFAVMPDPLCGVFTSTEAGLDTAGVVKICATMPVSTAGSGFLAGPLSVVEVIRIGSPERAPVASIDGRLTG